VNIEHGSFTSLVFTPYGGSSRETQRFISVLAFSIAEKRKLAISINELALLKDILRSTSLGDIMCSRITLIEEETNF
jgi:hypothetical protein